jgi:hypothetical protein
MLLLCCSLVMAVLLFGCNKKEVEDQLDKLEPQVQSAIEYKASLDKILEAARSGVLSADSDIAKAVLPLLQPADAEKFRAALAQGRSALETTAELANVAGVSAQELIRQFTVLRERLATMEDTEDATWAVIQWAVGAFVPVAGGLIAWFSNRRGRKSGAKAVAASIAKGRQLDPALNAAFESGPGAAAMKVSLAMNGKDIVQTVKAHKTLT